MAIFYSPSKAGFFDTDIHASFFMQTGGASEAGGEVHFEVDPNGPVADAVEVSPDEHAALLAAQAEGYMIKADAGGFPVAVAPTLEQAKASLCAQIDGARDGAYTAIAGNNPGRLSEYEWAGKEAEAFKQAGYIGEVPESLAAWVEATGWSAQQACDNIIDTATAWSAARASVRRSCLVGKANVTAAADVATAQAAADAAMAAIRAAVPEEA